MTGATSEFKSLNVSCPLTLLLGAVGSDAGFFLGTTPHVIDIFIHFFYGAISDRDHCEQKGQQS